MSDGTVMCNLIVLRSRDLDRAHSFYRALAIIRGKLQQLLEERRAGGQQSTDAIRRQIGDLDREIERATENFLRAPSEVLDLVGEKLTGLKRQRDHAREQLRAIETANGPATATDEAETTIARLGRLENDLLNGEPARRREVYRELIDKIELRFKKKPRGKRTECPLLSGLIFLRTGEGGIFGSVSRGDWHSFEPAREVFEPYLAAAIDGLDAALAMLATQAMRG